MAEVCVITGGGTRDAAFRHAVELAPISVPDEAVEAEHALLLAEFKHRLTYDSMATGRPLYQYEGLEEQLEALKSEAVFHVKAKLVLDDVIERENLSVSAEELEEEGRAVARRQGMTLEQVKDLLGAGLGMLKRDLLERKALDFIVSHIN